MLSDLLSILHNALSQAQTGETAVRKGLIGKGKWKWGWEWVCSAARDAHGNKGLKLKPKLVACVSLTDDAAR